MNQHPPETPETAPGNEQPAFARPARIPARMPVATPPRPPVRTMLRAPSPLTLPTMRRGDALLDLAVILLAALAYPLGMSLAATLLLDIDEFGLGADETAFLVAQKWLECLIIVGIAAYLCLRHGLPRSSFGFVPARWWKELLWAIAALAGAYAVLILGVILLTPVVLLFPSLAEASQQQQEQFVEIMPTDNNAIAAFLLLAVAIHEEVLFRGLLLTYLRRLLGSWVAAIALSSMLFGLLHFTQGPLVFVPITLLGCAFSITFVLSRSLLPVIVAHFFFNLIQFQLFRLLPHIQQWLEQHGQMVE